jgi:DNA-entry nuclease
MKRLTSLLALLLVLCLCLSGCDAFSSLWEKEKAPSDLEENDRPSSTEVGFASVDGIPDYSGEPYVVLNGNQPDFKTEEITATSYEYYSELDYLGRCGYTVACVGKDLMPTEDRGSIGQVKPTGWQTVKYDIVDGKYLYNRCHLIGFQLTGENANRENLITGTRYLNIEGMLPFENQVAAYVKETGNHVMYRVTPVFVGTELVARGVVIEGYSVEDEGEEISFCVFAYNVQPGIRINYKNGESMLWGDGEFEEEESSSDSLPSSEEESFVLNTSSKKYHRETCSGVHSMNPQNREDYVGSREELEEQGYEPCGICKP